MITQAGFPASPTPAESARHAFTDEIAALLGRIATLNAEAIESAAAAILATIRADRLVHVGGAGHGLILALESFYRAGGLACIDPIWRPRLLPIAGARASTRAERSTDTGANLAIEAGIEPGDTLVVASQSGVNPVAIDLAATARARGATAIAIVSVAHAASAPSRHPEGWRLPDVADVVIDTCVRPGDASWPSDGDRRPRVAPLSTIASCHAWNLVLVTLVERAGALPLPIWSSSNIPGGDQANANLLERYGSRVAAL
jgi:uncharacterized phosphosugar-binding protein